MINNEQLNTILNTIENVTHNLIEMVAQLMEKSSSASTKPKDYTPKDSSKKLFDWERTYVLKRLVSKTVIKEFHNEKDVSKEGNTNSFRCGFKIDNEPKLKYSYKAEKPDAGRPTEDSLHIW